MAALEVMSDDPNFMSAYVSSERECNCYLYAPVECLDTDTTSDSCTSRCTLIGYFVDDIAKYVVKYVVDRDLVGIVLREDDMDTGVDIDMDEEIWTVLALCFMSVGSPVAGWHL